MSATASGEPPRSPNINITGSGNQTDQKKGDQTDANQRGHKLLNNRRRQNRSIRSLQINRIKNLGAERTNFIALHIFSHASIDRRVRQGHPRDFFFELIAALEPWHIAGRELVFAVAFVFHNDGIVGGVAPARHRSALHRRLRNSVAFPITLSGSPLSVVQPAANHLMYSHGFF